MPANDLIVNVQQVGGYPLLDHLVSASDVLLVQQGGLGGPYKSITQDGLLGQVFERVNVGILPAPDNQGIASSYLITPLGQRQGFNWYTDDDGVQRYLQNGPAGYWSMVDTAGNLQWATVPSGEKDDPIDTTAWKVIFNLAPDPALTVPSITITNPPSAPTDAATVQWVQAHAVASFNTRVGSVTLTLADVTGVGGAPLASPHLTGAPTAPTPAPADSSTAIATTAFVVAALAALPAHVASFNTRTGPVVLNSADISGAGGALAASPVFTGVPAAPTATVGTNTTQLATTAFVTAAVPTTIGSGAVFGQDADFSTAITLTAADSGKIKNCTATGAVTVTLPNNLAKDFYCTITQTGAGTVAFAPAAGATLHNRQSLTHTAGQWAICCLLVSANGTGSAAVYILGGDCA